MTNDEVLFAGSRFRVVRVQRVTDAGVSKAREVVRHPGAAVILPMVDADTVCLVRNYRDAVARWLIELPAGTLEPPEQSEATAQRELIEETGYRPGSIQRLNAFYPSPGILDERMVLYLATELTPGQPAREAGEEIENLVVPWQEAIAMVLDGRIEDAKTIVGLLYYDRIRQVNDQSHCET